MVTLASPQEIEGRSHGAVDNPDTINYRTGKPKMKWLFCESIFWPVKNYECSCGKYKGVRYKGIVCERCGVEVTSSRVRRERMGHIELASPVLHAWYKSNTSGWVHHLLNLSGHEIDRILAFVKYVVAKPVTEANRQDIREKIEKQFEQKNKELESLYKDELEKVAKEKKKEKRLIGEKEVTKIYEENKSGLQKEFNRLKSIISALDKGTTILESDYRNIFWQFVDAVHFKSWPEAVLSMLQNIDVEKEIEERVKTFHTIKSKEKRKKTFALIKLLINLHISGVRPENMILKKLPVIPPDLRPVVQLEGWKFASSDVNLFYRRVLMRNIRLKKMIQVGMPDVVKKNEIRLLQESVNNLLVGEKWASSRKWAWVKVFKALTDMLSGKEWVFRKNLLGKRVDYSGRSVITVWPDLKLNECGIPLYIAVKMFAPFIIGKLIEKKVAYTPKQAEKLIKDEDPIALKYLQEVIKDRYVLLNRAPTLHRLSIEAFKVKLMPGKTIRLHPLVCPSFNADFDGDQMAVHLPISEQAQTEARDLIAADKNILVPASWEPTITHSQDMVLGIYYLTDAYDSRYPEYNTPEERQNNVPLKWYFSSIEEVLSKYNSSDLGIKDKIILTWKGEHMQTTVGRVIFNTILPEQLQFLNQQFGKKHLKKLLSKIFDECGMEETVKVADAIKNLWFKYSTISSTTINVIDMKVPKEKEELLQQGDKRANKVYTFYYRWFLSEEEKHRLVIGVRNDVKSKIEDHVKEIVKHWDSMFAMVDSWARWSASHTTQLSGMKWLVLNQLGEIIELPIKTSYVEGLNPIEYFITAHGGRKGKADTALRTAESGYLTRKLCDASQEVIIREEDCNSTDYIIVSRQEAQMNGESLEDALYGRIVAEDVADENGTIIVREWEAIDKDSVKMIEESDIEFVKIRTPLTCQTISWVCQKCYGYDLATRSLVKIGTPIGILAAQSIGEPATQLTLNTFHGGGVAGKDADLAQGIERVKQLFEIRIPKNPAIIAPFDGTLHITEKGKMRFLSVISDYQKVPYFTKEEYECMVKVWENLKKWWVYAVKWKSKLKVKEWWEVLEVTKEGIVLGVKQEFKRWLTGLSPLKNTPWAQVYKWEVLTTGALDIKELKSIVGDLEAQKYIIKEINKVYASQWGRVNNRHVEVVVKQMFSKVFIEDTGDSSFIPGTHVKYEDFRKVNKKLEEEGKKPSTGKRLALWLTTIAKETDSWLSAASFQETVRVMVDASLKWSIDELSDLKANVIIGRLLPVGDVYRRRMAKEQKIVRESPEEEDA